MSFRENVLVGIGENMKTRARKVQFWSKASKQLVLSFMQTAVVVTTDVAKSVVLVTVSIAVVIKLLADSVAAVARGGGGTPYNGLYGEAPPERGTFFKLQV